MSTVLSRYGRALRRRMRFVGPGLALALLVVGGFTPARAAGGTNGSLQLTSPAFGDQQSIPERYTCDGAGISFPLRWSGVPAGTRSLALIVEDPDAPDPRAPRMTWIHWVAYDIPPGSGGLPDGDNASAFPAGMRQGLNSWQRTGYGGPCPPIGTHRYVIRLFALDTRLGDLDHPTREKLVRAMRGHVLARARLVGLYHRHR